MICPKWIQALLVYHRADHLKFGDDLNEVVWPGLAPEMFEQRVASTDGFFGFRTLVGRSFQEVSRVHVFSSRVGYDPLAAVSASNHYWCVRGPLSARALQLPPDRAIVDGGMLAPERLGIGRGPGSGKPVVIPHWQSMLVGGWEEACDLAGFDLIDPMQSRAMVIGSIASAPLVLTESFTARSLQMFCGSRGSPS